MPHYGSTNFHKNTLQEIPGHYPDNTQLIQAVLCDTTGEITSELMNKFSTLESLVKADARLLASIKGIGDKTAKRLIAALQLGIRASCEKDLDLPTVASPNDAVDYLYPLVNALNYETIWILCLNTRNRVLSADMLYAGNVNSAIIRMSEIFKPAILTASPAIIMAHNHPSGDPSPSPEDTRISKK